MLRRRVSAHRCDGERAGGGVMYKLAFRVAMIALAIGALVVTADAKGGGGGGGGGRGGGGSHGGGSHGGGSHGGGSVGRSFSVHSGGSRAAFSRSVGGPRFSSRGVSSRAYARSGSHKWTT